MMNRTCSRCKKSLPVEDFNRKKKGYQSRCRNCSRHIQWEHRYGITHEDYERLLNQQEGLCAICRQPELVWGQLAVDHDHTTNEVRGLLCHKCNPLLGYARDNIEILENAIKYLKENNCYV